MGRVRQQPTFLLISPPTVRIKDQALIPSFTISSTIEQAVEGAISSDLSSIRATALVWSVPRTKLSRRLDGGVSRMEGHSSQQPLSPTQEKMLVKWILEQERLGHALTHQRIREFEAKIRGFSGEDPRIGKNWLRKFMQRNPAIRTKVGRKIDYQRVQNILPEVLEPWFHLYPIRG
jgi:Tc5 transposase DNA-binding domain